MKTNLISYIKRAFIALIIFMSASSLYADVVWPALVIKTTSIYYTWYLIVLGIVIEWLIVMRLVAGNWHVKKYSKPLFKKSFLVTILMNAVSAFIGIILSFFFDGLWQAFIEPYIGSWHTLIYLIAISIFAIAASTFIESYVLMWFYPSIQKKRVLYYVFIANLFSSAVAIFGALPWILKELSRLGF